MAHIVFRCERFFTYMGVRIYHTYKDDYEDVCLDYWYSTCGTALSDSEYEFDVRELPGYRDSCGADRREHRRVISAAIKAGLLQQDEPPQRGDSA